MPKYSPEIIRKVSEANDIVDIVSKYVPLKQKGRLYSACCPFHNEKTPSFHVDREKQLYHCFGCGAGGDLYSFIMEKENLQFPEAVEFLADQAGIELPQNTTFNSKLEKEKAEKRNTLFKIHQLTANYYFKNLINNQNARNYLRDRGIDLNMIKMFGLGYAPNEWSRLYTLLKRSGFKDQDILDSGLVLPGKKGNNPYDRFRGRVIIPIQNVMGKVIGFGARKITEEDQGPKYLNSPETPIFSKGEQLFNLNKAKGEVRQDPLLIVEGYMDVIALASYGFKNAAAALGTAFTPDHSKLISRYTKDIILCFDGDAAGEKATFKAIDILSNSNLNIKVLRLPVEHDPDSFIRENGTEAFRKEVEKSIPVIDFKLNILERDNDLSSSQGILTYVGQSCTLLKDLNEIEQDYYASRVAEKSGIDISAIKHQINDLSGKAKKKINVPIRPQATPRPVVIPKVKKTPKRIPKELVDAQKIFLLYAYQEPEILTSLGITEDKMSKGFFKWLYRQLLKLNQKTPDLSQLFSDQENRKFENMVSSLFLNSGYRISLDDLDLLNRAVSVIERHYRNQQIEDLQKQLVTADKDQQEVIYNKLLELKKVGWV